VDRIEDAEQVREVRVAVGGDGDAERPEGYGRHAGPRRGGSCRLGVAVADRERAHDARVGQPRGGGRRPRRGQCHPGDVAVAVDASPRRQRCAGARTSEVADAVARVGVEADVDDVLTAGGVQRGFRAQDS
jgi:hypothetical protein